MSALSDLLDKYKQDYADDLFKQGQAFEIVCKYFLMHAPIFKTRVVMFKNVWLWNEWSGNNNQHDTGIDIVVERSDGKFCAAQCKFYSEDHKIDLDDTAKFIAASSDDSKFVERMFFSVYGNFTEHAQNALNAQKIKTRHFILKDLESCGIDWEKFDPKDLKKVAYLPKELKDHQKEAFNKVIEGFQDHDRGKMIMACGTGKTFTSLRIAENFAGAGKKVLYLVPSIALLNQALSDWSADHDKNLKMVFFAVCSDDTVGKRLDDDEDMKIDDLITPATTNAHNLITEWNKLDESRKNEAMTVIFSTYQSLECIKEIQDAGFPDFDLAVCDEAHRTTGYNLSGEKDSDFTNIHKADYIHVRKRLYMTATPRIYGDNIKSKAKKAEAEIISMDDQNKYGVEFYNLSFSDAVNKYHQLTDFKVMLLGVPKSKTHDDDRKNNKITKSKFKDKSDDLNDFELFAGCWHALTKSNIYFDDEEFLASDPAPMKTAIAYTQKIKQSEDFAEQFPVFIEGVNQNAKSPIQYEVKHVDGSMSMNERAQKIAFLKENLESGQNENTCRILSNARCLSEGVDVPALDGIIFLTPRRSEIDIIQCVGRVMRKYEGKKFGYIILPVLVYDDETPEEVLEKNERYKNIWKVLQALRSNDKAFNIEINSLELNKHSRKIGFGIVIPDDDSDKLDPDKLREQQIYIIEKYKGWIDDMKIRVVKHCGDQKYWDMWANDMAKTAEKHITLLNQLLEKNNYGVQTIFNDYLKRLREIINESITQEDAAQMLSQHMITKPMFDSAFKNFSQSNPISKAMQEILDALNKCGLADETKHLEELYDSVKARFDVVEKESDRQKIIKDLYETFFRTAFKKTSEKLGIVYTPNEVVDFILRSCEWAAENVLKISGGLKSDNICILDPFTGTGTFIVRLIQLGLLPPEILKHKYNNGLIFANEILLLAYYIAAVNIESAYHDFVKDENFSEFSGMVFTDTFNLKHNQIQGTLFHENGLRAERENDSPVNVIIGNPPYSVGQKNANDNNKNTAYETLDQEIKADYVQHSTATNKNSIYDSYMRAIKWAELKIKDRGIICYVTNGAFIDSSSADGLRKSLYENFQRIYIFNLRGNQRSGDWRKEGAKIFGEGSQNAVAITLLIKNPDAKDEHKIFYHESPDGQTRKDKLDSLVKFQSFGNMQAVNELKELIPDKYNDWIKQRGKDFDIFLRLGNKKEPDQFAIFGVHYSAGIKTNRDAWCYNFSREAVKNNMKAMIEIYNQERERWHNYKDADENIQNVVTNDPHKISWDSNLLRTFKRNLELTFNEKNIVFSLYRPFVKEYLFFHQYLNDSIYRMPSIFPTPEHENLLIVLSGIGAGKGFSVLMTDTLPCLDLVDKCQCFPLYWYEEIEKTNNKQLDLFSKNSAPKYERHDAISDEALKKFNEYYSDWSITKEDIFYYIYGVLSSNEYKERYCNDVRKVLARVPMSKNFRDFLEAGKKLARLHLKYELISPYELEIIYDSSDGEAIEPEKKYRVEKMRLIEKNNERQIKYNAYITIAGIPSEAWDYIVNGKSALEWIIERYRNSTDKDSGIINDCNAWPVEHEDEKYILKLIGRVVRVSVETMKIINALPDLNI